MMNKLLFLLFLFLTSCVSLPKKCPDTNLYSYRSMYRQLNKSYFAGWYKQKLLYMIEWDCTCEEIRDTLRADMYKMEIGKAVMLRDIKNKQ